MAITRIHAIKATVARSVNYICNPDKTDSGILIYSHGTVPEYAATSFALALSHTDKNDPNLAYHLIQSFAPGEVKPQEAHGIGKELAERLLRGRYSYILSTHTDRNHCHNHLIFCAADNIDHKKYHDCKKTYREIRRINDELCAEHGLSVIKDSRGRSKSYKEWLEDKNGNSWKTQLRRDINECIRQSHIYDDFILLMRSKGYEVKDSDYDETDHKFICFRAPGYTRWVRGKANTLGSEYTKERIRDRIENKGKIRTEKMLKNPSAPSSIIDTTDEKFRENKHLMNWAKRQNLKTAARIQSLLAEKKLDDYQALDTAIEALHQQSKNSRKATVALDKKIAEFENLLHYARVYSENKKYLRAYSKSKDPDRYYRLHGDRIEMATGAVHHLKNAGLDPDRINLSQMEKDYSMMAGDRTKTYAAYRSAEKEFKELTRLRDDLMAYKKNAPSREKERDRKRSL